MVNSPAAFVEVAVCVFFTLTVTPSKGNLDSGSVTLPVTVTSCASAVM